MSKKTKSKAKAKRAFVFAKRTPDFYKKMLKAGKFETAGDLIRSRLVEGKLSPDQIVSQVKAKFKGSSAKRSDVYWNRARLKKEGVALPKKAAPKKAAK